MNITLDCVGQACLLYLATKLSLAAYNFISEYVFASTFNFKKIGEWAVVTGATDGIGLAYVRALAKQGQNIVLISRTMEKLEKIAKEVESKYNVSTKCIAADFSKNDIYENISSQIQGLDISVLINNVGMSYDYPMCFTQIPDADNFADKMLAINVTSALKMCNIVMPLFAEKKKGVVLNISSASACRPTPLLTVYSAAKQFVDMFSKGLSWEYKSMGIVVQSITPFFVVSKLSKIRRPSLFIPTPDKFVSSALKTVGKSTSTYGYLPHAIQGLFAHYIAPEWLYCTLIKKSMEAMNKKALRRKAKAQ